MTKHNLPNRQMTALVVDDDISHRLLLETTLLAAGLQVESVENGELALHAFQTKSIDIVLMDVNMPLMDGFEACRHIRALDDGIDVPIILITGMDDHESIEQAFEVDATDFIIKPVNWPILGHRVNYYLKAGRVFKELRNSESNLKEAQEIALMGTWELDLTSNLLTFSKQLRELSETTNAPTHVDRTILLEKLHPDDKYIVAETINQSLHYKKPFDVEYRILLRNGVERIFHEQAKVNCDSSGKAIKMIGTVQDITSRKSFEKEIQHLAYFDVLTGLPNREKFKQLVNTALSRAKRENEKAALMFLDLDNFKHVNDTLGHDVGDKLLQSVAQNLKDCLRASDYITHYEPISLSISRLGGDEFTLIVSGLTHIEQFEGIARRVQEKLNQPIFINEQELLVTGSIGISVFPNDGDDLETLLKHADIAMYKAKDLGRNGFQFYSKSLNSHSKERLNFEARLKQSINNNELELYYQPQVESETGKLVGVEALVRWHDKKNGLISPQDFISIADKSEFILAMDEWVLNTACQQAAIWHDSGLNTLKVSVNISGKQLFKDNLKQTIKNALLRAKLAPQFLEIDISESDFCKYPEQSTEIIACVRDLGVKLAINDFGAGFSSLNHLRKFKVDTLKIDKSFIDNITTDEYESAIAKAMIELAKTLNLTMIAGGVEYKDQLTWLQENGGCLFQGYLFSKPLPVQEINRYFEQNIAEYNPKRP